MSTITIIIGWAVAIVVASFCWWLVKKIGIVGWVLTLLHRGNYWQPPVDPYVTDEHDMYD